MRYKETGIESFLLGEKSKLSYSNNSLTALSEEKNRETGYKGR